LLAAMLAALPGMSFLGRSLASQRTFVYGPVCVAAQWRGKGVLRGMYDALRREIAGDYDTGVLFVAKDNPHSLHAHADGLGMTLVGDFQFDARNYWTLAFPVPLPPHC
jgi:predicted GNAT superfamily acetyltransferase